MSKRRVLVATLACVIAASIVGFFVWRHFRTGASAKDRSAGVAAAPDGGKPKRKRPTARRPGALVSPRASAETSKGSASIAGRVVDTVTGRGVPNASLTFLRAGTALAADTSAEGHFELQGLEPGIYELFSISADGYAPFEADLGSGGITLRVEPDTRLRDVTFSLRALWLVEGTVTDPKGAPVSGAEVRTFEGGAQPATTDQDGRFAVDCSLGDVLEARHERFGPGRALCDRAAQLGRPVSIRLTDAAATGARGAIAGRIVAANGGGIAGATVSAERRDGPRASGPAAEVASGADGAFSLEALEAGVYDVSAARDGLATATVYGVQPGRRDVVLTLVAGGAIAGQVRDRASGGPVAGFSVVVWPMRGALERGPALIRTFFAPDGRFTIPGLAPGDYAVTALSAGRPAADERRVAVTAGTTRDVVLELAPGGRVHGTVHDANTGRPIAGARVALDGVVGEERSAVPLLTGTESDARGAFELEGIGSGRFSLSISAADHHHKLLGGLVLAASGALGPLRIELEPTAPNEAPKLELYGIGAVLRVQGDAVLVADVVAGAGAARAGLAPGDQILAVDGVPVAGLGFKGTIEHIRGPEGTAVRLSIRRGQSELALVAERGRVRR